MLELYNMTGLVIEMCGAGEGYAQSILQECPEVFVSPSELPQSVNWAMQCWCWQGPN